MAESRGDQVSFGWNTDAEASPQSAARPVRSNPPSQAKASTVARRVAPAKATATKTSEPQLPPDNELWDVHAAARFLKRSVSWVYHRAEDGTLPVRRLGGWGIRFIPGELRAWVESGGAERRR